MVEFCDKLCKKVYKLTFSQSLSLYKFLIKFDNLFGVYNASNTF